MVKKMPKKPLINRYQPIRTARIPSTGRGTPVWPKLTRSMAEAKKNSPIRPGIVRLVNEAGNGGIFMVGLVG